MGAIMFCALSDRSSVVGERERGFPETWRADVRVERKSRQKEEVALWELLFDRGKESTMVTRSMTWIT
jgi:hypothetical protein